MWWNCSLRRVTFHDGIFTIVPPPEQSRSAHYNTHLLLACHLLPLPSLLSVPCLTPSIFYKGHYITFLILLWTALWVSSFWLLVPCLAEMSLLTESACNNVFRPSHALSFCQCTHCIRIGRARGRARCTIQYDPQRLITLMVGWFLAWFCRHRFSLSSSD